MRGRGKEGIRSSLASSVTKGPELENLRLAKKDCKIA